uniref:Uncharacterized protein n=1 Tax=Talaromyces marneffei PM1 TaxID=1077442 RepID=A0A093VII6_TALMA
MPLYLGLHAEVSDSRPRLDVFAVLGLMRACAESESWSDLRSSVETNQHPGPDSGGGQLDFTKRMGFRPHNQTKH